MYRQLSGEGGLMSKGYETQLQARIACAFAGENTDETELPTGAWRR